MQLLRTLRPLSLSLFLAALLISPATARATVPTYRVDVVATLGATTLLEGASGVGHAVGSQTLLGVPQPFVATLAAGMQTLPLPAGYASGVAFDANDQGVIVGAVAVSGFPYDLGDPAIWTPNGLGGYDVALLATPATVSVSGQNLPVDGGQATAINAVGQIVGFSRIQGFQGGPTTLFSTSAAPINLSPLGFTALVRDLSDSGLIVGGRLRMDLQSQVVTPLGLPAPIGSVSFEDAIAFAVNDAGESVVAADLASVVNENYLTYLHDDANGYVRLNPSQLPSRFVGFYDNNDLGDVSASGGILFAEEGVLAGGYDELLEASFSDWNVDLGFIDDARRVVTRGRRPAFGDESILLLTPLAFGDADLDDDVDVQDLLIVAAAYGSSGTAWATGDFDRDGSTGFPDLQLMAPLYDDPTPLDGLGLDPAFLADWDLATNPPGPPVPSLGVGGLAVLLGTTLAATIRRARATAG